MASITITLSDEQFAILRRLAERDGLSPEEFLRREVERLLASRNDAFRNAAEYVLDKNKELYRRLASYSIRKTANALPELSLQSSSTQTLCVLRVLCVSERNTERLMDYSYSDVAGMIDHSLLQPNLTVDELEAGCRLAVAYETASVCILPYYLARSVELLRGSKVRPSTTIGFPHGGHTTATKQAEAQEAVAEGAVELDMVVNISQVLSGHWNYVRGDIQAVIDIAHANDRKVKVIFENAYLKDEHKIRLCEICSDLKADWVKTSTGYSPSGATIDDLKLMRKHSAPQVQVKAAGGVRDLDKLLEVRAIGVTRCGASRTAEMLGEARQRLGLPPIEVPGGEKSAGGY